MTALQRQQYQARMRTLATVRAEVFSPDGITLRLRAPVLCSRAINGPQKHREADGSVRTAL